MAMPTNGNAGAALGAYASRCGIESFAFAPQVRVNPYARAAPSRPPAARARALTPPPASHPPR